MEPKIDEAKGRIKEAAGALTDDDDLTREGKADQAGASVKEKAKEFADKAADKVEEGVDKVKEKLDRD